MDLGREALVLKGQMVAAVQAREEGMRQLAQETVGTSAWDTMAGGSPAYAVRVIPYTHDALKEVAHALTTIQGLVPQLNDVGHRNTIRTGLMDRLTTQRSLLQSCEEANCEMERAQQKVPALSPLPSSTPPITLVTVKSMGSMPQQ